MQALQNLELRIPRLLWVPPLLSFWHSSLSSIDTVDGSLAELSLLTNLQMFRMCAGPDTSGFKCLDLRPLVHLQHACLGDVQCNILQRGAAVPPPP